MTTTPTTQRRKLVTHASMIWHTIHAQSGSLEKALMELVMNSIDAGATRVDVTLTGRNFTVRDNGRGFTTHEEVAAWFDVFGFPHPEQDDHRVYGKFGIGRGQIWSFSPTRWRTGPFLMDVDVKMKGLEYDLTDSLPMYPGCLIEGEFYELVSVPDRESAERGLRELTAWAAVPVYLNGTLITLDPAAQKWTHETDDAWIKLKPTGDLAVYNLGMLVCKFPTYKFGTGGIVVTKPGRQLTLNTARNDVLVAKCAVWKRIRPYIQARATEAARRAQRPTEAQRTALAALWVAGDLENGHTEKLFTDVSGRHHSLIGLYYKRCAITLSPEEGSRLADRLHESGALVVLAPVMLERFGVESADALMERVTKAAGTATHLLPTFQPFESASSGMSGAYATVAEKFWTPHEKAVMAALRKYCARLLTSLEVKPRRLLLGESDASEAWTDGATHIHIERRVLEWAKKGLGGFVYLLNLLIHEAMHDQSSAGSHLHDSEFYQSYHEATLHRSLPGTYAAWMFGLYYQNCRKAKVATARLRESASLCEQAGLDLSNLSDADDCASPATLGESA